VIENQPALRRLDGHGACAAVATAADGKFESELTHPRYKAGYIACICNSNNGCWTAVDSAVEDGACLFIPRVVRSDDPSVEECAQF
jgi:hypothetical protein